MQHLRNGGRSLRCCDTMKKEGIAFSPSEKQNEGFQSFDLDQMSKTPRVERTGEHFHHLSSSFSSCPPKQQETLTFTPHRSPLLAVGSPLICSSVQRNAARRVECSRQRFEVTSCINLYFTHFSLSYGIRSGFNFCHLSSK